MGISVGVGTGRASVVLASTSKSTPLLLCWLTWSWVALVVRLVCVLRSFWSVLVVVCGALSGLSPVFQLVDKIVTSVLPVVGCASVELLARWSHLLDNKLLCSCCKDNSLGMVVLVCCAWACIVTGPCAWSQFCSAPVVILSPRQLSSRIKKVCCLPGNLLHLLLVVMLLCRLLLLLQIGLVLAGLCYCCWR